MRPKAAALLVAVSLFLIILLQNTQVVSFRFLFWKLSMSRIILFPLMLLTGLAAGFFMGRKSCK